MKKVVLLALFVAAITNAQIITIPDANFKAKLISSASSNLIAMNASNSWIKIDANNDGEIQVSEALAVTRLNVYSSGITSLEGLQSFTNLEVLACHDNQLTVLNLSSFSHLSEVHCQNNLLTTLDFSANPLMVMIDCADNLLTSIHVAGLSQLWVFKFSNNQITSLDVTGLTSVENFFGEYNLITTLDITPLTSMTSCDMNNNQLTAITTGNSTALKGLYCSNNHLTSVDVSGYPNLDTFYCESNLLPSLNVTGLVHLLTLKCGHNNLTTLDCSSNISLTNLGFNDNLLVTLYIKNGVYEGTENSDFIGNPNIQYVCADDFEVDAVAIASISCAHPVEVNSYCTFVPGADFNTIAGSMIFDANNNGCDALDATLPLIKMKINDGTTEGSTFTNSSGNYAFYTQSGDFTLTPDPENLNWFTFSPTNATVNFAAVNNSTSTQNFCIVANGNHPDLEIVIMPIDPARPGFDAQYKIVYKNKGNATLSGNISYSFNDDTTDFVSASVTPNSQVVGQLNWTYTDLLPFESRSILVTLNVNAPTETPAVNIGDVLPFAVAITPVVGDQSPEDNNFELHQVVVGSYDPNEIQCIEGDVVAATAIGKYLHYAVNFENTGTAPATNVVVKLDIDPTKFDINSLQILNASHQERTLVTGNKVEFIFENIDLANRTIDPPAGGHGNVLFKIKSKSDLVSGDQVMNTAKIYFDYNFPIATNDATTTFALLNNASFTRDHSVVLYPNPTVDKVIITAKNNISSVQLFDMHGRILETVFETKKEMTFDVSQRQSGTYFIKINTSAGSKIEKVIKK